MKAELTGVVVNREMRMESTEYGDSTQILGSFWCKLMAKMDRKDSVVEEKSRVWFEAFFLLRTLCLRSNLDCVYWSWAASMYGVHMPQSIKILIQASCTSSNRGQFHETKSERSLLSTSKRLICNLLPFSVLLFLSPNWSKKPQISNSKVYPGIRTQPAQTES